MAILEMSLDSWLEEISRSRKFSRDSRDAIKSMFYTQINYNLADDMKLSKEACLKDGENWNVFYSIIGKASMQNGLNTGSGYAFMLAETNKGILSAALELPQFLGFSQNSKIISEEELIGASVINTYYLSY